MEIMVVGAGVIGLSSAIVLAEAGHRVRLVAREQPQKTTSAAAGAIWHPISAAGDDRRLDWSRRSGLHFAALSRQPESGVLQLDLIEAVAHEPGDDWQALHPGLRSAGYGELPPGYTRGYRYTTYLIETPVYLHYLWQRLHSAGVTVQTGVASDLRSLLRPDQLVINCTGTWAGKLCGDEGVHPIRGQVIRLEPQPHLEHGIHIADGPLALTYIFPRVNDCILGGTREPDTWNRVPDAAIDADIWRRCLQVEPSLEGAKVLESRVGLRPGRQRVRLEKEEREEGTVIHNYGHDGLGYTLSWGCAEDVLALVNGH